MSSKREELNFILQRADKKELRKLYKQIKEENVVKILLAPVQQTLLQPIFDPISKGEFYGGEILVTTAIVSIGSKGSKGWAMVQDDNEKVSLHIAVCDAAFGAGYFTKEIENLVKETKKTMQINQKFINQKINATKVSFDLMS